MANLKIFLFIILLLSKMKKSLKVFVLTQNQGGLIKNLSNNEKIKENFDNFKEKLFLKISEKDPDVIIYGIQELIELKPLALFSKDKKNGIQNFAGLATSDLSTERECKIFKNILKEIFPLYNIKYNPNLSMVTYVLVKKNLEFKLKILKAVNQNGLFKKSNFNHGFWGQKGGIISLIEIFSKTEKIFFKLISINAHLDSKSPEQRFNQYQNLLSETKKIVDGKIENYTIFFSGDMNSRLTPNEKLLLKNETNINFNNLVSKYKLLFENNQRKNLELQIDDQYEHFEEFTNYLNLKEIYKMEEKFISFPPTYKLNFKTGKNCWMENFYEICYKKKNKLVFGYTDRIFYFKTKNQEISLNDDIDNYNILLSQLISDHHTVFAFFDISIVIEELKDFKNFSFNLEKVVIKNDTAIEELRKLLLFLDPEKNEEINNKLMEILNQSDFFFINTINLYEYLKKGESNCLELVGDENKIIFFNELKSNFLECYNIIKNKKFEAILTLEEIKNDEEEEEENLSDQFYIKNKLSNAIKNKYEFQIEFENLKRLRDKKDDILKNKDIEDFLEIENIEEINDMINFENYFNENFEEIKSNYGKQSLDRRMNLAPYSKNYKKPNNNIFKKNPSDDIFEKITTDYKNEVINKRAKIEQIQKNISDDNFQIKENNEKVLEDTNKEILYDELIDNFHSQKKKNRNVEILKRKGKGTQEKSIEIENGEGIFEDFVDRYKNERLNNIGSRLNIIVKRKINQFII